MSNFRCSLYNLKLITKLHSVSALDYLIRFKSNIHRGTKLFISAVSTLAEDCLYIRIIQTGSEMTYVKEHDITFIVKCIIDHLFYSCFFDFFAVDVQPSSSSWRLPVVRLGADENPELIHFAHSHELLKSGFTWPLPIVFSAHWGCMISRHTVHSNKFGGSSGLSVSLPWTFGSFIQPSKLHTEQYAHTGSCGCKQRR